MLSDWQRHTLIWCRKSVSLLRPVWIWIKVRPSWVRSGRVADSGVVKKRVVVYGRGPLVSILLNPSAIFFKDSFCSSPSGSSLVHSDTTFLLFPFPNASDCTAPISSTNSTTDDQLERHKTRPTTTTTTNNVLCCCYIVLSRQEQASIRRRNSHVTIPFREGRSWNHFLKRLYLC